MFDNETIDEMLTCFTKITNELSSFGDEIDNNQKVRKVSSSQGLGGQGNNSQRTQRS